MRTRTNAVNAYSSRHRIALGLVQFLFEIRSYAYFTIHDTRLVERREQIFHFNVRWKEHTDRLARRVALLSLTFAFLVFDRAVVFGNEVLQSISLQQLAAASFALAELFENVSIV